MSAPEEKGIGDLIEEFLEKLRAEPSLTPWMNVFLPMLTVMARQGTVRGTELFAQLVAGDSETATLELRRLSSDEEWEAIAAQLVTSGHLAAAQAVDDRASLIRAIATSLYYALLLLKATVLP